MASLAALSIPSTIGPSGGPVDLVWIEHQHTAMSARLQIADAAILQAQYEEVDEYFRFGRLKPSAEGAVSFQRRFGVRRTSSFRMVLI
jgi:hypothetical protein